MAHTIELDIREFSYIYIVLYLKKKERKNSFSFNATFNGKRKIKSDMLFWKYISYMPKHTFKKFLGVKKNENFVDARI